MTRLFAHSCLAWVPLALLCLNRAQLERGSAELDAKIAAVLPTPEEERWLEVPWRLDLVQARAEAQRLGKPLFLWINEGHPLGCV